MLDLDARRRTQSSLLLRRQLPKLADQKSLQQHGSTLGFALDALRRENMYREEGPGFELSH